MVLPHFIIHLEPQLHSPTVIVEPETEVTKTECSLVTPSPL